MSRFCTVRKQALFLSPSGAQTVALRPWLRTSTFSSTRLIHSHDQRIQDPEQPEKSMREAEKQKQLNLHGETVSSIPEVPGWNDLLASDSEVIVKAEREATSDVHKMQEQTIHVIEEREKVEQRHLHEQEVTRGGGGSFNEGQDIVRAAREASKHERAGP
ncbi:hypothetical protein QOT17_009084 [Balamuthia mandrillaris]